MPDESRVFRVGQCQTSYLSPQHETYLSDRTRIFNLPISRALAVTIEGYAGIPANAQIRALVGWGCGSIMVPLCEQDDPENQWEVALQGGARDVGFILTNAFGCNAIQFFLDQAVTGDVTITIRPIDLGAFKKDP